jgi:hypothetical protein
MLERTEERFGPKPQRLAADFAYGAAPMLNWLAEEKQVAPHILVVDKSKRDDGTLSREDFHYDDVADAYTCPTGETLMTTGTLVNDGTTLLHLATVVRGIALRALSKPDAVPKPRFAECLAASANVPAKSPARLPVPKPSSSRGTTESVSR